MSHGAIMIPTIPTRHGGSVAPPSHSSHPHHAFQQSPSFSNKPKHILPLPRTLPIQFDERTLHPSLLLPVSASSFVPPTPGRFPGAPLTPYLSLLPHSALGLPEGSTSDADARPRDEAFSGAGMYADEWDGERTLYLAVDGRAQTWSVVWAVPSKRIGANACLRVLTLSPTPRGGAWKNMGPLTTGERTTTHMRAYEHEYRGGLRRDGTRFVRIGTSGLGPYERRELGAIAWNVGVIAGGNEKNWIAAVLSVCVCRGTLKEEDVRRAMEEAMRGNAGLEEITVEGH